MPHLQLELSRDLAANCPVDDILQALVDELAGRVTVDPKSVKAYARIADQWAMGPGAPAGFVHLTVCVLEGRTREWESETSDALYRLMTERLGTLANGASVTLELRRMEAATYRKAGTAGTDRPEYQRT